MQVNKKVQLSCRKVLTPRISSDNIHLRCETSKLREAGDQMTKQERIKRLSEAIEAVPEEKKDYILGIAEGKIGRAHV